MENKSSELAFVNTEANFSRNNGNTEASAGRVVMSPRHSDALYNSPRSVATYRNFSFCAKWYKSKDQSEVGAASHPRTAECKRYDDPELVGGCIASALSAKLVIPAAWQEEWA